MAQKKPIKPAVTLVLPTSADGCLISQDSQALDRVKTWKDSNQVKSIIYQFFDFANKKDAYTLVVGEAVVKLGVNEQSFVPKKSHLRLLVLDQTESISPLGLQNLSNSVQDLIYLAPSKVWPTSQQVKVSNVSFITYDEPKPNLQLILRQVVEQHDVKQVTIQSAGEMNARWLQAGVVDHLTLIVYPLLVSNNGAAVLTTKELFKIKTLNLVSFGVFDRNYISLQYDVVNKVRSNKRADKH